MCKPRFCTLNFQERRQRVKGFLPIIEFETMNDTGKNCQKTALKLPNIVANS